MATQYQIAPIPFTAVKVNDGFWTPRLETNRTVTIPYDFQKCEETGRIDNFAKAAGFMDGEHVGIFYNDSDVFKVIEGAAYSLHVVPDPTLDAYLDDLIRKIAGAQEPDGYLYTARTINPAAVQAEREGLTRWSNLRVNHELYNVGHLYEAAVAHYQATGKSSLLDVALKNANLIDTIFGPDNKHDVPGHQEIELGLAKLYQVTGDERYLRLAKFFLDERGQAHGRDLYANFSNSGYMQDHLPVVQQSEAVGHSVRAVYMYCGMADVAALSGDEDYIKAIDNIWDNVVEKKLYLTGGIGARHQGEAFGENYELPNDTAYNETCAAIANILWNQRMFLLHRQAKYLDVLERTLYNGFLAGIAFSGDHFFYPNPLAADGQTAFNKGATTRSPWFDCSCCPTNVVRLLPSLPGYIYAQQADNIYVNLFISSQTQLEIAGQLVRVQQETGYPWHGQMRLKLTPEAPLEFTLLLRIPGWAQNQPVPSDLYRYVDNQTEAITLTVNGEAQALNISDGFARLKRVWQPDDIVQLSLPLAVRRVASHPNITTNKGLLALERGPLVYCVEGVDHGGTISHLTLDGSTEVGIEHRSDFLNGLTVIQGDGLLAIPYYAWGHRGAGEMAVWLPTQKR